MPRVKAFVVSLVAICAVIGSVLVLRVPPPHHDPATPRLGTPEGNLQFLRGRVAEFGEIQGESATQSTQDILRRRIPQLGEPQI